jgi:hypothetical protein
LNSNKSNELLVLLTNELFTKDFNVQKIEKAKDPTFCRYLKSHNRYNVLSYIFYLNDIDNGGEIVFNNVTIKPEKGKLVLFPEEYGYNFTNPNHDNQFIIYGQLCYDNVL